MNGTQSALNGRHKTTLAVTSNPGRMSGAAVIGVSRVPVSALLDNFAEGHDLDRFLQSFHSVTREECVAALDYLKELLDEGALAKPVSY